MKEPAGESAADPTVPHPDPSPEERQLEALMRITEATVLGPSKRIFVNRTLRCDQIRQVGFDMDYTLARYQKRTMEELSFRLTAERLVEKLGYPEEVLELPYDPSFVCRGLVVDKKLGNIFKMDHHHHVGRVYHGRQALPKEERRRLYRNVKIRLGSRKYHLLDTLFALPEAVLYAEIIDLFERRLKRKRIDYWLLFDEIRHSIDECHRDGSLKSIVVADIGKYVEEDPELPQTLHRLRSAGKRLFLLTNSYWEYTEQVMRYLLDQRLPEYPSWQAYFDLILVGCQKPRFFTEDRPFFEVDRLSGRVSEHPADHFERHHAYQGGSIRRFERLAGAVGDSILYVGDHIYGDIIRSKKDTMWRTALILPELEEELHLKRSLQRAEADLIEADERRTSLEHELTQLRLQITAVEHAIDDRPEREGEVQELIQLRKQLRLMLDRGKKDLETALERRTALHDTVDRAYNTYWGSAFKEGSENSAFGRQVEMYACVYTARVSNFLYYSPNQFFRAPRHWMPHEKL